MMTTKKIGGEEEVCDETCDCHDEPTTVEINEYGGTGMSDAMKDLISRSKNKDLKIKVGK